MHLRNPDLRWLISLDAAASFFAACFFAALIPKIPFPLMKSRTTLLRPEHRKNLLKNTSTMKSVSEFFGDFGGHAQMLVKARKIGLES